MAILKDKYLQVYQEKDNINRFTISLTKNKLSHAYLLVGSNLSRKLEFAYYMASVVLKVTEHHLMQLLNDEYQNSYMISAETIIKKEQILKLQEEFHKTSLMDGKRVYIIDGAEKMNVHASNSLLKFIEEPNDDVIGILTTDNLEKILPTIKSRCQIIFFSDFNIFELAKELSKSYDEDLSLLVSTLGIPYEKMIQLLESGTAEKLHLLLNDTMNSLINHKFLLIQLKNHLDFFKSREQLILYVEILTFVFTEVFEYNIGSTKNSFQFDYNKLLQRYSRNNLVNILNKLCEYNKCLEHNGNVGLLSDLIMNTLESGE